MPQIPIDLALQPKQLELARLIDATGPKAPTIIGYGGALGGGKSAAIRRVMLYRRFKYKKTKGIIVRRVWKDLKENHIDAFWLDYPQIRQFWSAQNKEIILPNGSVIGFMYAETWADIERQFNGPEYFDIFVDQAEQFSERELLQIGTRNRWPGYGQGATKVALFFNPGGIGTEYLRRIFWLKRYQNEEWAGNYAFVHAFGWDNYEWFRGLNDLTEHDFYALSSEERFELFISTTQYGRAINALPQALREGLLLGSFEKFAGQYFSGVWDESRCIVGIDKATELIQPWWTRWTSTDWGHAHYTCHHWWATGKISPAQLFALNGCRSQMPIDVVICYRELLINGSANKVMAQAIVDATPESERRQISREFFSPERFSSQGNENTIADQFDEIYTANGLPKCERANDDRVDGWQLLYEGFRLTSMSHQAELPPEHALGGTILLISANCPATIEAIPMLVRNTKDPGKAEDVLKTEQKADDIGDCLRYGYKSMLGPRNKAPKEVRAKEAWEAAPADPTQKALAMRKFELGEKKPGHRRWR